MSQEDIRQLVQLLENELKPDKNTREQSEKILLQSAESNPTQMVDTLLEVLKSRRNFTIVPESPASSKKAACIWLQKILSFYQSSLPELYSKVSEPVREKFKKDIFLILHQEPNSDIRKQIADTIGEVGGSLLSSEEVAKSLNTTNDTLWPTLIPNVMELYSLGDEKSLESALNIFTVLFMYISEKLGSMHADVANMIQKSMETSNSKIQMLAIQTLGSLITTLPPKAVKQYFKFSVPVLKIAFDLFFGKNGNIDHAGEVLSVIAEIVECDPKFFRTNFKDLIELMSRVRAATDIETAVRDQALEITVSISQRYPEFLQQHKEILSQIVEMIFMHMLEIPDECPEEWSNPPDGFDEKKSDDESQRVVSFATDCIDRLCSNVGSETMLKYLSDCVAQLLKSGDWKKIFASFMALSQVGEYMNEVEEIAPIVQLLVNNSTHKEPRVRFAVLHCIGQLSDDFAPKFQEEFHGQALPVLMNLMDDPCPRVKAHACASSTNFIENCEEEHLRPQFETLFGKITNIIDTGSSFVKENALSALSALSVGATELFQSKYETTMEVLLKILIQINDPKYKRLRGNSIECISIISQQVGMERFQQFSERVIQAMIQIQDHHLDKDEDPQRNFILQAWPRITEIMKGSFDRYIPLVVPSIIRVCMHVSENIPKDDNTADSTMAEDDEKKKREDVRTFFDDECNNALATLGSFMEDCPASMAPYVEKIYSILGPLLDYETNEEVRTTSAECLPALINCLKSHPEFQAKAGNFTKELIERLWLVMDEESEPEVLIKQATAIQDLVESCGPIMTDVELEQMYNKCIEHLKKSDERKKMTDNQIDEEEDEPEVLEVHEQDKDLEDQLHCTIAEIFGKLYQSHKERALPIFEQLHNLFIAASLEDKQNYMIKKFGLFLICDSIDHLGTLVGDAKLEQYYQYLKKFALNPVVFVRHAAVYGLGALAQCLQAKFGPCVMETLKILNESLKLPRGAEDEEIYKATRDNTASSIGKIIEATWPLHNEETLKLMVNEWLLLLPLKYDKQEAIIQHRFLCDLLEKQQNIIFNRIENFEKVLKCIASIWKTKSSNDELNVRMSALLKQWSNDPKMVEAMAKASLTEKQQSWVKKALDANTQN